MLVGFTDSVFYDLYDAEGYRSGVRPIERKPEDPDRLHVTLPTDTCTTQTDYFVLKHQGDERTVIAIDCDMVPEILPEGWEVAIQEPIWLGGRQIQRILFLASSGLLLVPRSWQKNGGWVEIQARYFWPSRYKILFPQRTAERIGHPSG